MRLMIAAATLAAAALPVFAQPSDEPAFPPEQVRAHVTFLADDLLEGRDAGSRGYDIAALYVASRFAALGLEPAGTKGWYQPVGFARATLKKDAPASVTIGGRVFANGGDVVIGAYPGAADQAVEAGAAFVGYGLDSPQHGFDDYSGIDVRGKIVVMLAGMPEGRASSEITAHLSAQKAKMAERRGAIGVVTIATPQSLARWPWQRTQDSISTARYTWIDPTGKPWSATPGLTISAQAHGAAAEALFAGARQSLKSVQASAARKGALPRGFPLPATVRLERHNAIERIDSPNIIGMIPGSDPQLRNEIVMVTAHLDHNGVDATLDGDKVYNGAMDNAAGIATMLEVARAFSEGTSRPKRSVMFAAVTAEEDGLLGSQYLAKHPVVAPSSRVVGVVNLDMPVLTYDFSDVIAFGGERSTLGPIAARAVERAGVKLSPDPMPEQGVFTRSDHYSFVVEGVPSIMLATGFSGEGKDRFLGFLNGLYHTPGDDLSQDFNWQAGAKFARINYLIARDIADAAQAPRWYEGDFFGDTFAPGKPRATAPAAAPTPRK